MLSLESAHKRSICEDWSSLLVFFATQEQEEAKDRNVRYLSQESSIHNMIPKEIIEIIEEE